MKKRGYTFLLGWLLFVIVGMGLLQISEFSDGSSSYCWNRDQKPLECKIGTFLWNQRSVVDPIFSIIKILLSVWPIVGLFAMHRLRAKTPALRPVSIFKTLGFWTFLPGYLLYLFAVVVAFSDETDPLGAALALTFGIPWLLFAYVCALIAMIELIHRT